MRTDGVYCRESARTGPVLGFGWIEVQPNHMYYTVLYYTVLYCSVLVLKKRSSDRGGGGRWAENVPAVGRDAIKRAYPGHGIAFPLEGWASSFRA